MNESIYCIVSIRAYYIPLYVYVLTMLETKQVFFLFDRKRHYDVIIQSLLMMMNSTHLRHWIYQTKLFKLFSEI
jgi:hypothetical protein